MQHSMVMFTFFVFGWKYPVWDNLVQKIKIVSLRGNLIPRLIKICWIHWCCSLFFVFDWKRPSWANLVQIVNVYSFFLFPFRNVLFGENLVQNVKIVSLRLNLLASPIRICRIQRRYSPFWFSIRNAFFWQVWSKIVSLKANFSS